MYKIICVTNRRLCEDDFLNRIERISESGISGIILREKYMSEDDYFYLAKDVLDICKKNNVPCMLHGFVNAAIKLGADRIHFPLDILRNISGSEKKKFSVIGASCHSAEDAEEAVLLGANYITAGHIFDTDCKKGLPGRGVDFLREVCGRSAVPVYAVGGISADNIGDVVSAGAAGVCIMSGLMKCADPKDYIRNLRGETK